MDRATLCLIDIDSFLSERLSLNVWSTKFKGRAKPNDDKVVIGLDNNEGLEFYLQEVGSSILSNKYIIDALSLHCCQITTSKCPTSPYAYTFENLCTLPTWLSRGNTLGCTPLYIIKQEVRTQSTYVVCCCLLVTIELIFTGD